MEESMSKGIWIAFGIGVCAGAAVALLYAPQSGKTTRRKIRSGVDDAQDYLADAGDYLKEQADRLSKEAKKAMEATKDKFDDVVDVANDVVAKAAKTVKSAQTLM
jgi:gas vesicle protein